MSWFNRFNVGVRLGAAFLVLLLLLTGIAGFGAWGIHRTQEGVRAVYEDHMLPIQRLAQINYLMARNRILVMDMMVNPYPDNLKKRNVELLSNIDKVSGLWDEYRSREAARDERSLMEDWSALRKKFMEQGLIAARDAVLRADLDRANQVYVEIISPLAGQLQKLTDALIQVQVDQSAAEYDTADRTERFILWSGGTVAALAIALGVWLTRAITRSITRPTWRAVQASERVAQGDLSTVVAERARDEMGRLLGTLARMQHSLGQVVAEVRTGADQVAQASAEIAAGNHDLSARTEQQASALEQTAAAMSQLNSAVTQNAAATREGQALAQQACAVARESGGMMDQLVNTMGDIEASAHRVRDIVGVIDSIAFQTNILALNAAVEAARAGEQGRGFAVVATEVRQLAGRSALAAKEIHSLIGDSVAQVSAGSALATRTGETLQRLVGRVEQVSSVIESIHAASQEQSVGITQVDQAVTELDRATQQNAALVEQMAAAAASLSTQATALTRSVQVFRLPQDAASSVAQTTEVTSWPAPAIAHSLG